MKALLVSIICSAVVFSVVVLGAAYGFAATLVITGVDDIGNQTVSMEMYSDVGATNPIDTNEPGVAALACTITGGLTCNLN